MANEPPNRYSGKDIDRFTDIFHEYSDDIDEEKDPDVDFYNVYESFCADYDNDNDPNPNIFDLNHEEQHLSQKLSQLSAETAAAIVAYE
jgi:hypothetical protein